MLKFANLLVILECNLIWGGNDLQKNKLLLVAGILGTAYLVYLVSHFAGSMGAADQAEAVGGAMATAIATPHMICVGLAVVFNWLGFFGGYPWGALVAGILYSVSVLFMFIYAPFVLVQLILCFIAFGKMKKA